MDPFEDFMDDPTGEVPDIDLDIQLDGGDIMDLDCDPDFNNFLRELADEDPLACFDSPNGCEATSSYEKTTLNVVTASGAEDSHSPPRSPSGSSGNESCQYGGAYSGAQCGILPCQVRDGTGKISIGRRAKLVARTASPRQGPLRSFAATLGTIHLERLQAESDDIRSLRVKERNRLYAARTRQRKNRLLQDLRDRCSDLEAENAQLQSRVLHLQAEVNVLRSDKCSTGAVPRAHDLGASPHSSPTPSSNTECPLPGAPGILSVKPTAVRTAPNQKAKNKFRFTAAAAAACSTPQDDTATGTVHTTPASTTCCGSDSRSSDTPGDKGTIQSYRGPAAQHTGSQPAVKPDPEQFTALKRPMECTLTGTARRVRGRGIASGRSQAPLSMATISVLALAAVSCLVLLAFPALTMLSPGAAPVDPSGIMAAPRHTRALLSDPEAGISAVQRLALTADGEEDGLVPYQRLSGGVAQDDDYHEYDDWVGVDDDAHHVLVSAAFVCNHTACVAVPKGGAPWTRVVPQTPVEVRQEDKHARNSLEATVFSALGGARLAGSHPASFSADEHLRGDRPGDGDAAQEHCADGSCEESRQSTGEALSMAGLLAPQSCTLVLRSRGAGRTPAVGSEIAQTLSDPVRVNAVVEAGQPGTAGGVALMKAGQQPASQQQQVTIGKGLSKSENQNIVSVLFPAWKSEVEEEGVLTPMRHMYVLVAEGEDLLTYECGLSRALYI